MPINPDDRCMSMVNLDKQMGHGNIPFIDTGSTENQMQRMPLILEMFDFCPCAVEVCLRPQFVSINNLGTFQLIPLDAVRRL